MHLVEILLTIFVFTEQYLDAADVILEFNSDRTVKQFVGKGDRTLALFAEQVEPTDMNESSPSAHEPENTEAATRLAVLTESMQDHHKGDTELYLFFFKTAPAWMFAVFFAAAIVNTLAERASRTRLPFYIFVHYAKELLTVSSYLYALLGRASWRLDKVISCLCRAWCCSMSCIHCF